MKDLNPPKTVRQTADFTRKSPLIHKFNILLFSNLIINILKFSFNFLFEFPLFIQQVPICDVLFGLFYKISFLR